MFRIDSFIILNFQKIIYVVYRKYITFEKIVREEELLLHGVLVKSAGNSLVAQFSATTRHRITWLSQFQTIKSCAVDRKN